MGHLLHDSSTGHLLHRSTTGHLIYRPLNGIYLTFAGSVSAGQFSLSGGTYFLPLVSAGLWSLQPEYIDDAHSSNLFVTSTGGWRAKVSCTDGTDPMCWGYSGWQHTQQFGSYTFEALYEEGGGTSDVTSLSVSASPP